MLSTAAVPPHNLGLYRLEGFVGQQEELAWLQEWLAGRQAGLAVVTGPAGAGKSTLVTVAAWSAREAFPGGMVWVSAAGEERFRREDIFFELDTVLDSTILIQPMELRQAAALQVLHAEPRLLVLDELERLSSPDRPEILELLSQLAQCEPSRVVLISQAVPAAWESLLGPHRLTPGPLKAAELAAMAGTAVAPPECAAILDGRWEEVARWTQGNPLLARLALGLAADASATGGEATALLAHLASEPLHRWLEAALAALQARAPTAAQLLSRLALTSGGADQAALASCYWRDLGPPEGLEPAVQSLVRRGLVARDETRVFLHPAVRDYLLQRVPESEVPQMAALQEDLAGYYLTVAEEYGRRPRQEWAEIDVEWPNIRHFANLTAERLAAELGAPPEDLVERRDLPPVPRVVAERAEGFALALLPVILWRHPRASRRWLTAGRLAARLLGHPHRAAQLEAALGGLCYVLGEPECAVRHFRAARAAFDELGDLHRLMQTEMELGGVLKALGRHQEAIETFRGVVALAESAGDELDRATAYAQLGAAYHAAGEPFRAIEWLDRARPTLARTGGPALAALLNNLGLAYEAIGRYREAIEVYRQSFELIEPTTRASQQQLSTIAGNIGAAYYELGELEEALTWYRRDLSLSQAIGDLVGAAATHHNIGHVLLEMGIPQGAMAEFTRAAEIYRRLGLEKLAAEEEESLAYATARVEKASQGANP